MQFNIFSPSSLEIYVYLEQLQSFSIIFPACVTLVTSPAFALVATKLISRTSADRPIIYGADSICDSRDPTGKSAAGGSKSTT